MDCGELGNDASLECVKDGGRILTPTYIEVPVPCVASGCPRMFPWSQTIRSEGDLKTLETTVVLLTEG